MDRKDSAVVAFPQKGKARRTAKRAGAKPRAPVVAVGAELTLHWQRVVHDAQEPCAFLHLPPRERIEFMGIDAICDRMVDGESLVSIAKWLEVGYTTLRKWILADPERERMYIEAKQDRADTYAELIYEIASEDPGLNKDGNTDTGAVQDKRVRIDALKWIAAKMKPHVYGERLELAEVPKELTPEQAIARVGVLLQRAAVDPAKLIAFLTNKQPEGADAPSGG